MPSLSRFIVPVDQVFVLVVVLYTLICAGLMTAYGLTEHFRPLMYLSTGAQMSGTFLLGYVLYRLLRAVYLLLRHKPESPSRFLWQDLKDGPLRPEIYKRGIPVFIAFLVFFSIFTSMKVFIAQINPFAWDEFFMKLDRTLHFGIDPWRLLHPVLGYPIVTKVIAFLYILWLPLFFLVLYWQLFRLHDEKLRMQFLYTFVLTWAINGTFLAIVFCSAGPVYYHYVVGSDYFLPLLDYLNEANRHYEIYQVKTQRLLWESYTSKKAILGGGISAMPSVHVGTAFLFVLLGRRINRYWLWGFLLFFIAILLGSAHLAWHYMIDGYLAIIVTGLIWWFSGRLVKNKLT